MKRKWLILKSHPMVCPYCNENFDDAGMAGPDAPPDARPKPGHTVICTMCGEFTIITEDGKSIRKITPEELATIQTKPWFMSAFTDSILIKAKYQQSRN